MENEMIKIASTQGLWAALTVVLIYYILKAQEKRDTRQEEREQKYQEIILNLSDKLNLIEDVKADVSEIRKFLSTK